MLNKLCLLNTDGTDPRHNLALEEVLMSRTGPDEGILYLWQNRHTVVIGRNQDPYAECRVQTLLADGGFLVRRLSGGGAVYHDAGNVNFTFLARKEDFDVECQTRIILDAVRSLGINAGKNGRNDLTVQGKKFSGHAYHRGRNVCFHHGTLMLDVDMPALERYLNVPQEKLAHKGVRSVRSRVINLKNLKPHLTPQDLKKALAAAYSAFYGLPLQELSETELPEAEIREKERRYSDPGWTYGRGKTMEEWIEKRFSWGSVCLGYSVDQGRITDAALFSDGLSAEYLASVPERLKGCRMEHASLLYALLQGEETGPEAEDIAALLMGGNG